MKTHCNQVSIAMLPAMPRQNSERPGGLGVKLPPGHLSTTNGEGFNVL